MTTKTFRATETGYVQGRPIAAEATFTIDVDEFKTNTGDDFKPNWAVEIDDGHKPTPDNAGEQEALDGVLDRDAALPKIAHPDQPLPQFHPALALSMDQANAENADKTVDVKSTAELLAEEAAKPKRSRKRKDSDAISTGTEPSDGEKDDAKDASAAEVEADEAHDDGNDLV